MLLNNEENKIASKRQKYLIIFIVAFSFFCSAAFALAIFYHDLNQQIKANEDYISSLIEEVGTLKQDGMELDQQIKEMQENVSILKGVTGSSEIIKKVARASSFNADSYANNFELLILGTNGVHTDTIMIASVNEDLKTISLFSIPRDLYINGRRINEYYTYYGLEQLKKILSDVTGLEIEKYVQVDLQGFTDIVDILGGVDVMVDKAIYDSYYPSSEIKGAYKAYSIEAGEHHMSGEEALKYARSRYSTSDFDRAERQQKVLEALKTKLVTLHPLSDLKSVGETFKSAMEHTTTDVNLFDAISYYYDYQNYDIESGLVISNQNYLYSSINENGAYMLLPNTNNFEEIKKAIAELVYN